MKVQAQVLDVDYTVKDGSPVVRVYGKTADGKSFRAVETGFRPYFYAELENDYGLQDVADDIGEALVHDGEEIPVIDIEEVSMVDGREQKEFLKISAREPPHVPKLRREVEDVEGVSGTREFDIPFYKRYIIDKGFSPAEWIEIRGKELETDKFDISLEIDSLEGIKKEQDQEWDVLAFDLELNDGKIVMASLVDQDSAKVFTFREVDREFVTTVEDEKSLIEGLFEQIKSRDYDIVTGYNTDEFDFKKLRERAQHHGMEVDLGRNGERVKFKRRGRFSAARIKGRAHIDLYPFVDHVLSQGMDSETLDLDSVAEELLGKNKDDVSWEQMKSMWEENRDLGEFADYSLKDSELVYELADELIPQVLELSQISGLLPFDACRLTYGQLTENFLLREASRRNMVAPNRPSRNKQRRRQNQGAYEGGFVYTPDSGIHHGIGVFDFRSLYPTVMVAHNISPETLDIEDCGDAYDIEELGYSFCQDFQGFFPELVEELVEERYELKKQLDDLEEDSKEFRSVYSRQEAEKILANSFYGYLGYNGARWYSREAAEATTFLGRKYIEDTIETASEMGLEVVYGDTDSVFLKNEDIRENIDEFLDKVNSDLPEFMELEFEGYFDTGFFTSTESGEGAKKKYALMKSDGEMKITGFEQVRRDWSPVAKKTQKEVLKKVLNEKPDEAAGHVKQVVEMLREGEVDVEDLRIYTTLTKPPEEYDATAPHVEAARKAIKRGEKIEEGDTISYVITDGGGSISERAEIVKYADTYDSGYYIDSQIVPVSNRVLKVFGYTEDQLKGKGKQSGLGQFG